MDFESFQLLQHSIREHLACINRSSTKVLVGLNAIWKQVEAPRMIQRGDMRGTASQAETLRLETCGSCWITARVSIVIVINVSSPLKQSLPFYAFSVSL